MRVLVVGEGKSGTTALMRSVAACLDEPTIVFEPPQIESHHLDADDVVIKKVLEGWRGNEYALAERFDKRLFIVRDPRDRLISHLLYDAYNRGPTLGPGRRKKWLSLLEKKAAEPGAVSVQKMIQMWWRLTHVDLMSTYVRSLDRGRAFQRQSGQSFFLVSYEDYVRGEFTDLRNYLGLELEKGVVTKVESRVSRSQSSGAWRDWFTPIDVALFRPMTHRWLHETGGDKSDWELNDNPRIDRKTSVDYVSRLLDQRPFVPSDQR